MVDVAIGVIVRAGQVLVCRRKKHGTFPGYWEFPGGKREGDESPADCLARELMEELAVGVRVAGEFPVIEHEYPDAHVRLFPFLCRDVEGEPRALTSEELAWVGPERLKGLRFPEANGGLVKEVMALLEKEARGG
jgi:8-oxo-dGTP diphosphatase